VSDEVERLRAELDEATASAAAWQRTAHDALGALAALREAALNELAADFSLEAGTYAEHGSGPTGERHLAANIATNAALYDAALAAPCSSLSTAYRAKVRREAMEEVAATMETIGWQQEYCFQSHDRVRFAHWLRALAAKGSE
jgi:hypothetical protein